MAVATGHHDWEGVASNAAKHDLVDRMKVPGGWLYRNIILADDNTRACMTLVFVPFSEGREEREFVRGVG